VLRLQGVLALLTRAALFVTRGLGPRPTPHELALLIRTSSTPEMPARRVVSARHRIGFYVYEYEASDADEEGHFVDRDARVPAQAHL
jgi:hypothetical protein